MLKGYRTILFNVALALLAVTDYLIGVSGMFPQILDSPKHATVAVVAVGVANVLLRFITDGPVGRR